MPKFWGMIWVSAVCAAGQSLGGAGTIRGVVTDASGGAASGARVVVSNPATGSSAERLTQHDGSFLITGLAPARYHLRVELVGFPPRLMDVTVRSGVPM